MKCPFLRSANVRYCDASAYRKMILEAASRSAGERCSTSAWSDCPAAESRLIGQRCGDRCPFLHDAQAEFCGAAGVTKYIPASHDVLSRCNSDGHLYCEVYLLHADPTGDRLPEVHKRRDTDPVVPDVDGIPVPVDRWYSSNHMWLAVADDGVCHVGIDGFLASVIGTAEQISFVSTRGGTRPMAVITVGGVDLSLAFPHALHGLSANVYLRTRPEKLTADPYGAGWLFEGVEPSGGDAPGAVLTGLLHGREAAAWIRAEASRLTQFVHECASRPAADGTQYVADGGIAIEGVASHLDRGDLLNLFNEFFSSQPSIGGRV